MSPARKIGDCPCASPCAGTADWSPRSCPAPCWTGSRGERAIERWPWRRRTPKRRALSPRRSRTSLARWGGASSGSPSMHRRPLAGGAVADAKSTFLPPGFQHSRRRAWTSGRECWPPVEPTFPGRTAGAVAAREQDLDALRLRTVRGASNQLRGHRGLSLRDRAGAAAHPRPQINGRGLSNAVGRHRRGDRMGAGCAGGSSPAHRRRLEA